MAGKHNRLAIDETRNQPPSAERASDLAVRQEPTPLPGAPPQPLHIRVLRVLQTAERDRRMAEAAQWNNVLVALQDARYKASLVDPGDEVGKALQREMAAL